MRRAARRDDSEAAIVEHLRAIGYSVQQLSDPDVPDLLVARAGRMWLLECKSDGGGLRPGQREWIQRWPAPVGVVRSPAEAYEWVSHLAQVYDAEPEPGSVSIVAGG